MTTLMTTGGLDIPTLAEIKSEIELTQQTLISPSIDQSTTTAVGQNNAIFSQALAKIYEGLEAIWMSASPKTAASSALDRIVAITGTTRRSATRTKVSCSVYFDQTGTFASGTLLANPHGDEDHIFANVTDVVVASVPHTGTNILFQALDTGYVPVLLGPSGPTSLTEIASPVAGWSGIRATGGLVTGQPAETDLQLRQRQEDELFNAGSTSVNAIRSDLKNNVTGVLTVNVIENTSSSPVGLTPAYGIQAVVWPASVDSSQVASSIFRTKAAGTPTGGNTSATVTDDFGSLHTIKWSYPTEVGMLVSMSIGYLPGNGFSGATAVRNEIYAYATASWIPGKNVIRSDLSKVVASMQGVNQVDNVKVGTSFGTLANSNYTIDASQIATITSSTDIILEIYEASF
jgi:uncharacterized phage protein gp47/JayE